MLGAIYGVAVGDALGAPTELRNTKQIIETFGGFVTDFKPAPSDTFARDYPAGTVTDDFSMCYYLMKTLVDSNGVFNSEIARKAILAWGADYTYFDKFAGPTTRQALEQLQSGNVVSDPFGLINYNSQATNGGAMKTAPIALLAKGSWQLALDYTITLCKPTHFNSTAVSGAAAIAVAAAEAQQEHTSLEKIFEAAMWGAKQGRERLEQLDYIAVAPHIEYKIEQAIAIGASCTSFQDLLFKIDSQVGTNLQVSESVPAVFAIIAGTRGSLIEALKAGANVGGDTDTIAAMTGAILGGYCGSTSLPDSLIKSMCQANPTLAIEETVNAFVTLLLT